MKLSFQQNLSKSMLIVSMLLFFCPLLSVAQQVEPARNHAISNITSAKPNVPDTLTIVAVRVSFQRDDNRLTTGNGTFGSDNLSYLNSPEIAIDPLPHDRSYFESHLTFAKNYFEHVSGNQMTVKYRVLPETYQLPHKMESYSPTGQNFTNEKVARLAQDTWQQVEQQGGFSTSGLNPDKTAFVIFHAGVGRDIELVGTSLDKTPQDIPSLYLGQKSFSQLLNVPDFDGFDINDGQFQIINSLILPQTLSRRGENIAGEEFVLQLSINGLLCASIGSYLGLPDLFNTNTGSSGIGRFGLMDGESFFSYRGLFPPEPSAWEKIYLGWQFPFRITTEINGAISLPAADLHQNNSIARYALSGSEYFLVENRHRDPEGNGVTLTFKQPDGTIQSKQFTNRDEDFVNQNENFTDALISGVVTDVSNFDWSLPGGLDRGEDETAGTNDDRILNGGILIWHIDEAVIKSELDNRTVNTNPQRRGVDLEEADGAQDIGRAATDNFSNQARGTPFDFWWDGNNASVITLDNDTLSFYENRFGPHTRPSNESNSGASSFFEFYNFSENLPTATFRIRPHSSGDIQVATLPTDSLFDQTTFTSQNADYFSSYPLELSLFKTQADSFLIIPSQQTTYALNLIGGATPIFDFQSGQPQQPYIGTSLIIGEAPIQSQIDVTTWQWDGTSWNAAWGIQAQANEGFLSSLSDQTLLLDFTGQRINISDGSFKSPLVEPQQRSAALDGQFSVITGNSLHLQPDNRSYPISTSSDRSYTGAIRLTKNRSGFYYLSETELMTFEPRNFTQPITIVENTSLEWPAMTDINGDGRIDFVFINRTNGTVEARNLNGAMLSHFPIQPPEGTAFVGTPLITSSVQSNAPTLYLATQDSLSMNIRAYSAKGEPVEGFPLYVGNVSKQKNQPVHPIIRGNTLYAASHSGELKAWKLDNTDEILWGGRYGNAPYNKVSGNLKAGGSAPTSPNKILVKEETYNWPNPAEDYTNLRFQIRGPGSVDIKIITPGGRIIFKEHYQASGSVPEEHRIATQGWGSGVYFGMITANVNGRQARKMIKIVVIQ